MDSKFTKGPWVIKNRFNNPQHEDKLCSIVGGEYILAEVCGDVRSEQEASANSALIAAAPTMLEALNEVLEIEELYRWANEKNIGAEEYARRSAVVQKIRAAIKLAEGE